MAYFDGDDDDDACDDDALVFHLDLQPWRFHLMNDTRPTQEPSH